LQSCLQQQSVRSWLGVGQACFHLSEYEDSEDALTEANAINPKDGDVWAMIAVLCVRLGRSEEAHLAIAQARHLRVSQGHIVE
jgi:Flp pilus assembly protein TadD